MAKVRDALHRLDVGCLLVFETPSPEQEELTVHEVARSPRGAVSARERALKIIRTDDGLFAHRSTMALRPLGSKVVAYPPARVSGLLLSGAHQHVVDLDMRWLIEYVADHIRDVERLQARIPSVDGVGGIPIPEHHLGELCFNEPGR